MTTQEAWETNYSPVLIFCCLDSKSCVWYFSVRETFKSPWFLLSYKQCVLLIPMADIFSQIWRLKRKGKKPSQNINPTLKNISRCWSWSLVTVTTRVCQIPLSEIWPFAWNGHVSDGLWPLDLWLQPDGLKEKSGFGQAPPPGSIVYMTAPSSFVWLPSHTHKCSVGKAEKASTSWWWSLRRAWGTGKELSVYYRERC